MNKNKISLILLAAAFVIGIAILSSCGSKDEHTGNDKHKETTQTDNKQADNSKMVADGAYFCPMHPIQQTNDPNVKCPICKMKLDSKAEHNKKMMDEHTALENKYHDKKDLLHFEVTLPVIKSDECQVIIEEALSKDAGIVEYHTDILNRIIHMYIDKNKTSKSKVEKVISDAGFDANDTKANPEAAGKLPADCK
ncbi:MAG: hypothetical protein EHM58_15900 [Ignavibacteriae bacterium]|nr:MAG: hypothetical protein EHM58_15900 [Ignavibacteriota bacterium]